MKRSVYIFLGMIWWTSCSDGRFIPPTDAGDTSTVDTRLSGPAEPCDSPADCIEGTLCIGNRDGAFECMTSCSETYSMCDDGAVCLPATSEAICYTGGRTEVHDRCDSNLDCAPGMLCLGTEDQFYCLPACQEDGHCDGESFCDPLPNGGGLCRSTLGAKCDAINEPCAEPWGCSSQFAELFDSVGADYCTQSCLSDEDCGANGLCRTTPGWGSSFCLQTCKRPSDCRFNDLIECLEPADCDRHPVPDDCRALTDGGALCLPVF